MSEEKNKIKFDSEITAGYPVYEAVTLLTNPTAEALQNKNVFPNGEPYSVLQAQQEVLKNLANKSNLVYTYNNKKYEGEAAIAPILSNTNLNEVALLDELANIQKKGLATRFGQGYIRGLLKTLTPTAAATAAARYSPGATKFITAPLVGTFASFVPLESIMPEMDEISFDERSAYAAGETAGMITPGVGAVNFFKPDGKRTPVIGNFLNNVVKSYKQRPILSTVLESGALIGASAGAAFAEEVAPSRIGPRIIGEVAGGFANPIAAVRMLYGPAEKMITNALASMSIGGKEQIAAKKLQKILQETDGDISLIRQRINNDTDFDLPEGFAMPNFSLGAKTGDETLVLIEKSLGRERTGKLQEKAINDYMTMQKILKVLVDTGDPEAMKVAAQMRKESLDTLIKNRIKATEEAILQGSKNLNKENMRPEQIGAIIDDEINKALKNVNEIENSLWQNVKPQALGNVENLASVQEFIRLAKSKPTGFNFPKELNDFFGQFLAKDKSGRIMLKDGRAVDIKNIKKGDEPIILSSVNLDTDELVSFRSIALSKMRDNLSGTDPNTRLAREYAILAGKTLEDLDSIFQNVNSEAYRVASQYTKSKSDIFGQRFLANQKKKNKQLDKYMQPEEIYDNIKRGAASQTNIKIQNIQNVADYIENLFDSLPSGIKAEQIALRAKEDLSDVPKSLRGATENILQLMFLETRDSKGNFVPAKMDKFLTDHEPILKGFPQLFNDLKNIQTQKKLFDLASTMQTAYKDKLKNVKLFSSIIEDENPTYALHEIIGKSKKPIQELDDIWSVVSAAKNKDSAVEGMKTALFDFAYEMAGGGNEGFSFIIFQKLLTEPLRRGKQNTSLMNFMVDKGMIDQVQKNRLDKFIDQGVKVEKYKLGLSGDEKILENAPDFIVNFLEKSAGASGGMVITEALGMKNSLIAASAGSQVAQNIFSKIPNVAVKDLIYDAMLGGKKQDGQLLFDALMTKVKKEEDKALFVKPLYSYFLSSVFPRSTELAESFMDEPPAQAAPAQVAAPRPAPIVPEPAPPVTPPVTAAPQPAPFTIQPPAQGSSLSGIDIGQILREEEQRKLLGLER